MPRDMTTTRRQALGAGAAALGLAALSPAARAEPDERRWIDAHAHVWSSDLDRFPLAGRLGKKDLDPPSFTDDELMAVARPEGVDRVVLIQHSGYHLFDNSYLLDAVRRHPQRFRAVAMVDDGKPEPGAGMKRLLPEGATGFRITPFLREADAQRWLEPPGMHEMWRTASETRQAMCCLIGPQHLEPVNDMCIRHPETPVVIDHFARIGYDGPIRDADVKKLCDLARHRCLCVKVSAFYALGRKKPPHSELVPMIRRLFETFGPDRLMWASDAPYQIQGENTYADSIALVRDRLDFLSAADRETMLRRTAEKVFFFA